MYEFISETKGSDEMFFDNHDSIVRGLKEFVIDENHWKGVAGYDVIRAKYNAFVQTDNSARKVKNRLENK